MARYIVMGDHGNSCLVETGIRLHAKILVKQRHLREMPAQVRQCENKSHVQDNAIDLWQINVQETFSMLHYAGFNLPTSSLASDCKLGSS